MAGQGEGVRHVAGDEEPRTGIRQPGCGEASQVSVQVVGGANPPRAGTSGGNFGLNE